MYVKGIKTHPIPERLVQQKLHAAAAPVVARNRLDRHRVCEGSGGGACTMASLGYICCRAVCLSLVAPDKKKSPHPSLPTTTTIASPTQPPPIHGNIEVTRTVHTM